MAVFFDESYYLKSKLAQLKNTGEKDANGNDYTLESLRQTIADAGLTPETHYQQYGRTEKMNPNAYFNEAEYLQAKLNQLKSVGEKDENGNDFTLDTLVKAIEGIGLSVAEHYEQFGSRETDANGNLINPSNAFDANAYVAAKLYQLQTTGTEAEKAEWAGKTAADVVVAIAENGMSPVSHYEMHGATEANTGSIPLVQTVPVTQRVENDPARVEVTGEIVPSNYNAPTPPPVAVTADKAAPVAKPADMGGNANATISPVVTPPAKPVPVPGDADYVAPPANIVDTNDNPVVVVPPATAGGKPQFGVVNDNGTVSGVDANGNSTGTVIGKVDSDTGTVKPVVPTPVDPAPVDPTPPTPSTPEFSVKDTNGVLSFSHDNGTIEFSLDGTTATFKSGGVTRTVNNFDTESISLTATQTLKTDDVESLNGHTVTGGKVLAQLAHTTEIEDFSSPITVTDSQPSAGNAVWYPDRAKPEKFEVANGKLEQTIKGPNENLSNDFYGTQGYKHDLPEGTTSVSISLNIKEAWLTSDSEGKATRWAGFWGTASDNNGDISAYPIIEFAIRNGRAGFYGYNTETGEWSGFTPVSTAGDYTLNIQTNSDGTFTYSVNGKDFYTTPSQGNVDSTTLSNIILQGYSYKADNESYTSVNNEYTIQWDDLKTNATTVKSDLDLSGIAHLEINAPIKMAEGKTLTINAEQANTLAVDGLVHIDASGSSTGATVNAVEWAGKSNAWYNVKGFTDGKLTSVTGSDHDDFFSLDLAAIGTLTDSGNNVTFAATTGLKLNGGAGANDTLMLTWFAPAGTTAHTLSPLKADSFGTLSGFETLVFNKGNLSESLQIDASGFTSKGVKELQLKSSATITGIDDSLTIGFTEGKLASLAALNLSADNTGSDVLNLKLMDSNVGKGGFVALTATDFETINFTGSSTSYVETVATKAYTNSTAVSAFDELKSTGTINTVTVVTANSTTYIVATGGEANSNTDDWVVQLAGVTSQNLTVAGGTVTLDLSTTAQ